MISEVLIMLRKVKFYRNLLHSCNTVLSDVFFMFLFNNFSNDCVLQTIFMSPRNTMNRIRVYTECRPGIVSGSDDVLVWPIRVGVVQ